MYVTNPAWLTGPLPGTERANLRKRPFLGNVCYLIAPEARRRRRRRRRHHTLLARAGGAANDAILSYFAPLEGKIFFDRASGAGGASGVRLRRSASGAVASGDGYLML